MFWLFSTLIQRERDKQKTPDIDYLRRTGAIFSLSNIFISLRNAVIQVLSRVYEEIWPWRCWNSPWCSRNHSWICLAVWMGALPSLNTLSEQCIKRCTWSCKNASYFLVLHSYAELTSDLMPGMSWLQIHHAGVHVEKGWKRLITPYYFFQYSVVPEYMSLRVNLGYSRLTVSDFQMAVQLLISSLQSWWQFVFGNCTF